MFEEWLESAHEDDCESSSSEESFDDDEESFDSDEESFNSDEESFSSEDTGLSSSEDETQICN